VQNAPGLELSDNDRLRAAIIERLMCDLSIDLDPFGAAGSFKAEVDDLSPLAAEGLLDIEGYRITVTERGRPYVRIAAAAFDSYLVAGQKRHSLAV